MGIQVKDWEGPSKKQCLTRLDLPSSSWAGFISNGEMNKELETLSENQIDQA